MWYYGLGETLMWPAVLGWRYDVFSGETGPERRSVSLCWNVRVSRRNTKGVRHILGFGVPVVGALGTLDRSKVVDGP